MRDATRLLIKDLWLEVPQALATPEPDESTVRKRPSKIDELRYLLHMQCSKLADNLLKLHMLYPVYLMSLSLIEYGVKSDLIFAMKVSFPQSS